MVRIVNRNQRQPLSPLWEAFVMALWQPIFQRQYDEAKVSKEGPKYSGWRHLERAARFHPFNMTDSTINEGRARKILGMLEEIRSALPARRATGYLPWWPQDPARFVEALKQEREELSVLGYIVCNMSEQTGILRAGAEGKDLHKAKALKRKRRESAPSALH